MISIVGARRLTQIQDNLGALGDTPPDKALQRLEVDRILGLDAGADDYVTKPFSSRELVSRIRAVVRRARGLVGPPLKLIEAGVITIDPASVSAASARVDGVAAGGYSSNSSVRRSASSKSGPSVHSLSISRPTSGANARAVRSRRTTSSARFRAVARSHAEGLLGTPCYFPTSRARANASCATSSTSARLCTPKMRVSAATRRPDSRRNRCSSNSTTCF